MDIIDYLVVVGRVYVGGRIWSFLSFEDRFIIFKFLFCFVVVRLGII